MQLVFPNCIRKQVEFGFKVEVAKESINRRSETLILELNEAILYTLVKLKYWSGSSKNNWVFKKTNRTSNRLGTRGLVNYDDDDDDDYEDDDDDDDEDLLYYFLPFFCKFLIFEAPIY